MTRSFYTIIAAQFFPSLADSALFICHKVVWSDSAPGYLAISQNGILYIQSPDALVTVNLK